MNYRTVIGVILFVLGVVLLLYYGYVIKPERNANELVREAKLTFERGDKNSINQAVNILTKAIAKYPKSRAAIDAYYYIGRCYEKQGLNRLAYLKYNYILKNSSNKLTKELKKDLLVRFAHLNILKQYSEEAVNQLFSLLNHSTNKEFRSRIYSELGHIFLKTGKYKKARRMFEIAITEKGNNEDAILGKARANKRMGYEKKAYDLYEYFLEYFGAVSQYTQDVRKSYREQAYGSGLRAFRKGRYYDAISFFNRVLRNFPNYKRSENSLYWIGESYYAMKKYDTAISYFNRTLTNSFYHKDHDAQIKKGYSYFMSKRFDLAAKEFQRYLQNYPNGKYAPIAREWKKMSAKELLYRIKSKKLPQTKDAPKDEEEAILKEETANDKDEEVSGNKNFIQKNKVKLENVAEL